jgi:hypothetical protein
LNFFPLSNYNIKMSKKRTLSMGLDEEDDSGYELDLTPPEDVDTPKSIVNKSSPGSD